MGIHIRAYDKTGAALGILPDFTELKEQTSAEGTGSLTFKYLRDGVNASWLDMDELLLCVVEDGVAHPDYFMLEDDTDDPAASRGRSRGRYLDVAARHYMGVLDQAVVYPAGHNIDGSNLYGLAPQHTFTDKSPGNIMGVLINEAKARGCFPELTYDFTSAVDSAGRAWPTLYDITYPSGTDYFTVLADMVDDGWVDARMERRVLKLYVPDTYFGQMGWLLRAGQNVLSAPRKRSRRGIFSHMLAAGNTDKKANVQVANSTTAARFGRREGFISDGRMTNTTALSGVATRELSKHQQQREGFTLEMILDPPPGDWWPRPGIDFKVGDRLYYDKARKSATEFQPMLVQSMTWSWGDTKSAPKCSIELNDLFLKQSIKIARQVGAITGGSQTSRPPANPVPEPDTIPPEPPGSVWVTPASELVTAGILDPVYRCTATVTWTAPTLDSDGSLLSDLSFYEVSVRVNGGTWSATRQSTDTEDVYVDLRPGQTFQARVRSVDTSGNRSGFTTSDMATMPTDVVPPDAPSAPVLTTKAGTVKVTWDGLTAAGAAMPDDFHHCEVEQCSESTFTTLPKIVDRIYEPGSSAVIAGQPYGTPWYYRLIAVDVTGNRSTPSASASIATAQLVSADLAEDAVTEIALAPDAVRFEHILAGAIGVTKLAIADTANMAWINESQPGVIANHTVVTDGGGVRWSTRVDNSLTYLFRDTVGPIPFKAGDKIRVTYSAYTLSGTSSATPRVRYGDLTGWNLTPSSGYPATITTTPQDFSFVGTVPDTIGSNTTFSIGFATSTGVDVRVRSMRAYRMGAGELLIDGAILAQHMSANSVKADAIEAGAVDVQKLSAGVIRTNLVNDPGFEETYTLTNITDTGQGATTQWRKLAVGAGASVDRATVKARTGARRLVLGCGAGGSTATSAIAYSPVFKLAAGKSYRVNWYTLANGAGISTGTPLPNLLVEAVFGASGSTLDTATPTAVSEGVVNPPYVEYATITPDSYDAMSGDLVIAGGATNLYCALRFTATNNPAETYVYLDDVSVVEQGIGGALEITAAGMRLFDDEGDEATSLVTNRPNYFTVNRDGEAVAAVSNTGLAAFKGVSVTGNGDPNDLNDVTGLVVGGEDYAERMWRKPEGIVAQVYKGSAFSITKIRTEYGLYEVSWLHLPGRFYRVTASGGQVSTNATSNTVSVIQRSRYTNDGSTPSIASTSARSSRILLGGGAGYTLTLPPLITQGSFIGGATTPQVVRLLVTLQASNAGATEYLDYTNGSGGSLFTPIECIVEDLGPDVPDTFLINSGGGTLYTGGSDSGGGGSSPAAKKTYTSTWTANSSQTRRGSGASLGQYTVNDTAYTGSSKMLAGYYSGSNGNQFDLIGFTGTATSGETGKTISSALSGASVSKVELYVKNASFYYNSGGKQRFGMTALTGMTPSGTTQAPPATTYTSDRSFSTGQGQWITLPAAAASVVLGGGRVAMIGPGTSTSKTYYSGWNNHVASSGKPLLRITYTR